MKSFYSLLFIAIAFPLCSFSQEDNHEHIRECGQFQITEAYYNKYPEKRELARHQYSQALQRVNSNEVVTNRDEDFIIPVVFHVVHAYGEENISNEQIYSCLEVLNEDITAQNSSAGNVMSQFQDIVGSVSVEFRLAKIDPDGNCTSGINRVYNTATNDDAGDNIKSGDAATWGRDKYLNIWVVGNSAIGSGFAYFPWGGAPSAFDGIVLQHSYVGNIGTSNPTRSHNITHEVGHYLGLYHVWGNTNNAGEDGNCDSDDQIEDTPLTIGHNSCPIGIESCGSVDNVENYMDYSFCYKMFTQDQASVMTSVLENGESERDNLYSPENLEATGVLLEDELCQADFAPSIKPVICVGESIVFEDMSFHAPTQWKWTFEGGESDNSNESSPEVIYEEPGTYDVTLTVSDGTNSVSVTKEDFVTVLELGSEDLPFVEDFESVDELEDQDSGWFVLNLDETDVKWQLTNEASVSGSNSVYVNGRSNPVSNESIEYLDSKTLDLSGLTENAVLTFKYAHAKRFSSSDDQLRVFISKNCGENWSLRESLDIDELPTVDGNVSGQFFPSGPDEWQEVVIDNISPTFLNEFFRFRFEYRSFRGNNLFIDDINVFDPLVVSVEESASIKNLGVFPNPADNIARLTFESSNNHPVSIRIFDILGLEVFNYEQILFDDSRVDIDTSNLQSGIYLISLENQFGHETLRLIVGH